MKLHIPGKFGVCKGRREGGREGESCGVSAHIVLLEEKEVIEITHCSYADIFCWLNVALDWVEMGEVGRALRGRCIV